MAKKKKVTKKVSKKAVGKRDKRTNVNDKRGKGTPTRLDLKESRRPPAGKTSPYLVLSVIDDGEYNYEQGDCYLGGDKEVIAKLIKSGAIENENEDEVAIDFKKMDEDELKKYLVDEHNYLEDSLIDCDLKELRKLAKENEV